LICAHAAQSAFVIELRQCEAMDWVPTEDDAEYLRCPRDGAVIEERDEFGHVRHRSVCVDHGLDLCSAILADVSDG